MNPFLSIDPFNDSKDILHKFYILIQNKDIEYLRMVQQLINQRLKELDMNYKFIHLKKSLIIK